MAEETKSKLWTKDFIKIGLVRLSSSIGLQIVSTVLPVFLNERGFSASDIGLIATLFTACATVMRFTAGQLVDKKGRRKVGMLGAGFIASGLVAMIAAVIFEDTLSAGVQMFGKSLTIAMLLIILGRCCQGLGSSSINITSSTMVADVLPKDRFAEGIGYSGLFNSLSTAVGPAIGLILIEISSTLTFSTVLAVILLSYFLISSMRYESDPDYIAKVAAEDAETGDTEEPAGIWKYFEKRSLPAGAVLILMAISSAANTNFLTLYTKSIPVAGISLYYTIKAGFMIITRITSAKLGTKLGIYRTIMLGLAVLAGSYCISIFMKNTFMLYTCAILDGLGSGLCYPLLNVLTLNGVPSKRRGIANATYLITWDIGVGIGSSLFGRLIDITGGYPVIYVVSTVLIILGIPLCMYFKRHIPIYGE